MAEPFKNLLGPAVVHAAARHLHRVWPAFDAQRFTAAALSGLDALEMKARATQIADALQATMPADFEAAALLIEAALAPAPDHVELGKLAPSDKGLAGWVLWPVGIFIERRGIEKASQVPRALRTLHALTQRFTAEWAIRPFIDKHPALAFKTLQAWTSDPSPHVRRLVSEGSRPRLPWGLQLKALIKDPAPTLPLLLALQDDPSPYVRRSVANHLNDIGKDHPAVVAAWVEQHLPGATTERAALLRHASRSLIKKGDQRVLAAFGLGRALKGEATLSIAPASIKLGESVRLDVNVTSSARQQQKLVIDYAVHHVKAHGGTAAKVFKGWTVDLAPGETRSLQRQHAVRLITTRSYHAGRHAVELLINGRVAAAAEFGLVIPTARRRSGRDA
jgi:3-methyladenine DNA glycosylase AlkC